jgi:ubiquinone/menaquinone biosynthesis C-methylase UbiE
MKPSDWNKIAEKYDDEVVSSFQNGVRNPLFKALKKVENSKRKIVADIGCGRGDILDFLSRRFKKVYAIDFSPVMIDISRMRCPRKNTEFFVKDMRHLSEFKNKFDVAVSVNSIITPRIKDVRMVLKSIHSSLKRGGEFYAVFPSMDSILYQGFLIFEDQLDKCRNDERRAMRNTRRILERKKYNFISGTFNDDGQVQKFYYDFELRVRLRKAGFKNIKFLKVLYPWGEEVSDFMDFPGMPKMWDWFVSARK